MDVNKWLFVSLSVAYVLPGSIAVVIILGVPDVKAIIVKNYGMGVNYASRTIFRVSGQRFND